MLSVSSIGYWAKKQATFWAPQLMREPNTELDGSFGNLLQCSQICYTLTTTQAKFQGQISVLIDPTTKFTGIFLFLQIIENKLFAELIYVNLFSVQWLI